MTKYPVGWQVEKLHELGEIVTGNTPSKNHPEYYGGNIPWVKPSDLDKPDAVFKTDEYLTEEGANQARVLPKDTVMVSCIGNLGKVGMAGTSLATNQQINSIIFNNYIHPKFGFYACKRLQKALEHYAPATTVLIISKSKFAEFKIPVPPLPTQLKIASILEKAESARNKRRGANSLTDEFLRLVFMESYKKNYSMKKMTDIFSIKTGKLNSNAAVKNGIYPFFTCSRETFAINEFAFDQEALILSGNNANAEYSVKHYKGKFNAYQRTYVLILNNPNNYYEYFKVALENHLNVLKNRSIGSNTKNLTMGIMSRFQLAEPPKSEQQKFSNLVQKVETLKEKQRESEKELDNLFNSLMQRAFRGEII